MPESVGDLSFFRGLGKKVEASDASLKILELGAQSLSAQMDGAGSGDGSNLT